MKRMSDKRIELTAGHRAWGQVSSILKQLMKAEHVDAAELAEHTGIPQTTINRIRSNPKSNPTLSSLIPIASYFSVTVSQLVGDEPLPPHRLLGEQGAKKRSWSSIPLITWDQTTEWQKHSEDLKKDANTQWVYTDVTASDKCFAVSMRGDSMVPRFQEGTLLVLEPSLTPHNRDFVLVLLKGQKEPIFRQIFIDGAESYLKALNTDFKEIKSFEAGHGHIILGVMTQARMDFRQSE
jgi:SOS-response transcriptional repressor LexA